MTSQEGTQLLVPPPASKDEEDSSEALNKLKFHTKKMNWNLKILKDQLTGLEASGNSLSRQMASMYRTFQEMKEAGDISDVEIEIDEDELSSPNSRLSDTTGIGSSYDRSYSADDLMDTEDELEDFSDLETDSTNSSGQKKKKSHHSLLDGPDNGNEKRKKLTHRIKRQSSEGQCESDSDSECDNNNCSCCMSQSSFGSVTPSRRYYFEDRSRADDTSSSSCSDYEEPIKRNTMPLHERHSPFYIPGEGNSSSEEEEMCEDNVEYLLTRDNEDSLQKRLSPLGCESPIHYDSHGDIRNGQSGNESEDKSLEDKVKELTVELEQCKEEINKRTQQRNYEQMNDDVMEQNDKADLPKISTETPKHIRKQSSDNEAEFSGKSDSTLSSGKISDKKKLFENDSKINEQKIKPALKRQDSIGNAMMDKLKAQFENSDAKPSGTVLRENLGVKGRRASIKDKIKIIENKVQEESDKSDSSTLKSSSESRAIQTKLEASRKVSNALKHVFEKDLNQNDVSQDRKLPVKKSQVKNKQSEDQIQLLRVPPVEKHCKKSNKIPKESKSHCTSKHSGKSLLPRPTTSKELVPINPADETPDADYEKRDKVAAKKKFRELQNMWQPKLVVKASGKQPKPELQKRINRLQKAALNKGIAGSPKGGRRAVSRAVIQMNKKEKKEGPQRIEFSPESGEVTIGQPSETDKDGYKTVKLRGNGLVVTLKINPNGKNGKPGDVKVCPSCHNHNDKVSLKAIGDEIRLVIPHKMEDQGIAEGVRLVVPQNHKKSDQNQGTVQQAPQQIRVVPQSQHQRIPQVPQHHRIMESPQHKSAVPIAPRPQQTLQKVPQIQRLIPQTSQNQQRTIPLQSQMQRRVSVPTKIMKDVKIPVRKMSTSSITTYVNGPESSVPPGQKFITVTPSESYNNQTVPRVVLKNHQMNPETGQQRITVIPIQTPGQQTPRFQLKSVSGGGTVRTLQQAKSTTKYTIINSRQQST